MKKLQALSKNAKIHDGKNLKPFRYQKKLCSNLSSNPLSNSRGGFLAPRAKITQMSKMTKIFKKPEKNCKNSYSFASLCL